ncbi:MAG: helicase-exonuclease AddAB subunit AddA [Firmicutes bacterium]|nr:helicase-exonuclease AddAB subunit AddA [Bacillota bacterium]
MKWTDRQYKAINDRNKSILVAAAAGSGKTAVLVERIKQLILRDGCSLDRMLVVTFTNAAASEMKEKIEKAVRDEINHLSLDNEESSKVKISLLKKQLDLLPLAQISTFHSFSMEVVRKFFYVIGCEPNFKICDESNKAILQENAMEKLFENRYETGGEDFLQFLRKYCGSRDDNSVKDMIYQLSNRLESMPDPFVWLDERIAELDMGPEDFDNSRIKRAIMEYCDSVIQMCSRWLLQNKSFAENLKMEAGLMIVSSDIAKLKELEEALETDDYGILREKVKAFKPDTLKKAYFSQDGNPGLMEAELSEAKDFIVERRNAAKNAIYGLRDGILQTSPERIAEDIRLSKDDAAYLGGLVREFTDLYNEEKKKRGLMDFSDLEHYAFEILKDEEVADHYRSLFEYIFVDEYQDSNILQEALIERIARERNLFTVGDIKQSIYKFRLAEPEIFRSRYLRFKADESEKGEESSSEKIDLNQNFRSKKSIIDFVNEVFYEVMDEYGEDEALYAGDPFADRDNYPPTLYMVDENWDDDNEIDDAIKELKKTEKEALLSVKLIREYLGKTIFDSKAGKERPLLKRDIVILMRAIKDRGDIFYNVLMENGIPCFVDDNKGFFDTIEINTMLSLMEIIDNHKQDIQLLTVMRSEILGYKISELAEIRAAHKSGSYYDSLVDYSVNGEDEELKIKCQDTLAKISDWQGMAKVMPLEELVWKLINETGFYAAMGAMPGGALRQANLRLLADKALDYRKNQNGGLYGFVRYVDHVKTKDIKMGQAKIVSEDEDTVRIMTVHHSKGLEFPMVIVAGYARGLNAKPKQGKLTVDKELGIGLPIVDFENKWYRETVLQTLIKNKQKKEELEEDKRVLYVAMTRAKDILLMTGSIKDCENSIMSIKTALPKDGSFYLMTGGTIARSPGRLVAVPDKNVAKVMGLRKRSIKKALQILDEEPYAPDEETERIMSFSYPFEKELRIKSKYSVSELNKGSFEETAAFDPSVPRVPEETKLSAGHVGTVTHKVLEKLDFKSLTSLDEDGVLAAIDELISEMVEREMITREEGDAVKKSKLRDFVLCPLGKRIGRAQKDGKLYREKPFNLIMDVEGTEAIVQGIIDCFFEEDGNLILVDYKTTSPRYASGVRERYKIQMDIYRKALKEATGKQVTESYLYLTNLGITVDM